jgi:hypothetical protein
MSNAAKHVPAVALSIRQPWAWLILHAGKDVENRGWATRYRGPILVHAAKGCTRAEYEHAVAFALRVNPAIEGRIPALGDIERGGIVGMATLTDCVDSSKSPWFFGPCGFVLANAQPLDFFPCKGSLGLFRPNIRFHFQNHQPIAIQ